MSRLFLRLSAVVWLVTVLSTAVVVGISYIMGVFPPNDVRVETKRDLILATAAKILLSDGEGAVVTFGRQTTAVDPAMRLVLSRESSPSACSRPVGNEAAERLILRDDICWRLRLDAPQQGWLSTLLPKVTPLLVSVLTSLGAAFWIVRYFMGPLGKLRDGLSGLARGDFSRRIAPDPKQRDELAMLGRDFDQTAARLQEFQ